MADTYKVLGQSNPSATTLTTAYTVPGATVAIISSIVIANRSTATSFRISVAVAGAADSNEQYIAYDVAIAANETQTLTLGITLGAADVIRVYATLATLSFNIFGVERA
jgi:hypothetical protein